MSQRFISKARPRKRFGQNFLHDESVIHDILSAINPRVGENIVEIGPGKGALTAGLLANANALHVIELDRDLIPYLEHRFGSHAHFCIHQGDALKFYFDKLYQKDNTPLRIVGNLPYNISTPLIFHLLNFRMHIKNMYFMLQKEVVDRLTATPGNKNYGRLGLIVNYYCKATELFTVDASSFYPMPKVQSAVVCLEPYQQLPIICKDVSILEKIIRVSFGQRRKTLKKSLAAYLSEAMLFEIGISPKARPETLQLSHFIAIADYIYHLHSENSG